MYFRHFRTIEYAGFDVKDITQRVAFFEEISKNDFRSSDYIVKDGETPESLAQDFYDNPELFWVILAMNGMINPFTDWVLDTNQFESYLRRKYDNPDAVKEWVLPDGRRFPADPTLGLNLTGLQSQGIPITFRHYEELMNEAKRRIRVVRPEMMSKVLEQFTMLMRGIA